MDGVYTVFAGAKTCQLRNLGLCLPVSDHAAASAFDLFDTTAGTELKHDFKHTIVVKPKPTQKSTKHWWQFRHIVNLLKQVDKDP